MCNFCDFSNSSIGVTVTFHDTELILCFDGELIICDKISDEPGSGQINYCPFCGREL